MTHDTRSKAQKTRDACNWGVDDPKLPVKKKRNTAEKKRLDVAKINKAAKEAHEKKNDRSPEAQLKQAKENAANPKPPNPVAKKSMMEQKPSVTPVAKKKAAKKK